MDDRRSTMRDQQAPVLLQLPIASIPLYTPAPAPPARPAEPLQAEHAAEPASGQSFLQGLVDRHGRGPPRDQEGGSAHQLALQRKLHAARTEQRGHVRQPGAVSDTERIAAARSGQQIHWASAC